VDQSNSGNSIGGGEGGGYTIQPRCVRYKEEKRKMVGKRQGVKERQTIWQMDR
jgi:hypothetical protein